MLHRLIQTFLLLSAAFLSSYATGFVQSGYDALRKTHVSVLGDGQAARLDYGAMLGRNAESAHRLAADNIHIDFLIYFLSHDWRLNAISTKGGKP